MSKENTIRNNKLHGSLAVTIFREGKTFIAYSPALDLSTVGKTFQEVQSRFQEMIDIFFDELRERGTLTEALLDLGWEQTKN
jgi:predicted RNase H-like HicB family nuclease